MKALVAVWSGQTLRGEMGMKPDYAMFVNSTIQSGLFQTKIGAGMGILTEPLPSRENGNFDEFLPIDPYSQRKIIQAVDPKTPEGQKRLQEARRNAIPKSVYVKAVLRHCGECAGKIPVREDCEGHTRRDGTSCNLYSYNTPKKCKHATKTDLKKGIRRECKYCGGEEGYCGKCDLQLIFYRSIDPL